jgi:ATP adenylyltransferase/5',5'''-P-1,P-4-tetraphosphate phosphorylase II
MLFANEARLFQQEQLTSINQTYKSILKYREENVNGIKDDKQKIKENMKKLKEKLIQRINQVEKELTNKLEVLTHDLCVLARQSRQHSSSWSTQKYSTSQSLCCSQTRLDFFNSDAYDFCTKCSLLFYNYRICNGHTGNM